MNNHIRAPLNEHDEGAMMIAIGVENAHVTIHFQNRISWIGLSRKEAIALGKAIIEHAEKIVIN